MKKKNFVVSAVVIAVMLLAACSSASASSGDKQNTVAAEVNAPAAESSPAEVNAPAAGQAAAAGEETGPAAGKNAADGEETVSAADQAAAAGEETAPAAGQTAAAAEETAAEETAVKVAEPVVKTVTIPEKYQKELITRTGEEIEEADTIIAVYEKASIEANKALDEDLQDDYAGWLFSIGTVTEEEMHDLRCGDMSFAKVFAKDANGKYYVFYHPTDVSMVRKSDKYTEDELNHWSELTKWADSVPKTLMEENSSLTAVNYDNSEVSMMLSRAAYGEDQVYTLSTAGDGERKPADGKGKDAVPFVERLTRDVTVKVAEPKEKPEGEYITISFPEDEMRFDFFLTEGKKNYIRQVYVIEEEEGQFEEIEGEDFVAEFADGKTNAADIMQEWYDSLK